MRRVAIHFSSQNVKPYNLIHDHHTILSISNNRRCITTGRPFHQIHFSQLSLPLLHHDPNHPFTSLSLDVKSNNVYPGYCRHWYSETSKNKASPLNSLWTKWQKFVNSPLNESRKNLQSNESIPTQSTSNTIKEHFFQENQIKSSLSISKNSNMSTNEFLDQDHAAGHKRDSHKRDYAAKRLHQSSTFNISHFNRKSENEIKIGKDASNSVFKDRPIAQDQDRDARGHPYKVVEKICLAQSRGRSKFFEHTYIKRSMTQKELEQYYRDYNNTAPSSPRDFSNLFSKKTNMTQLVEKLSSFNLTFPTSSRLAQSFKSVLKFNEVKPMNYMLYSLGKDVVELRTYEALIRSFPQISFQFLVKMVSDTTDKGKISDCILANQLESFITLFPEIDLKKFKDPGSVCEQLAANAYFSLIGTIYYEFGYEQASNFMYQTLKIEDITPGEIQRLGFFRNCTKAKMHLKDLLYSLRLPLPNYTIEKIEYKNKSKKHAVVFSGSKPIGRGCGVTQQKAEQYAALDALLNYWCQKKKLSQDESQEERSESRVTHSNE